jgi:hypothetical protein
VKVRELQVEEIVERIVNTLMPLLDRSNRMMLRNLKALDDRRRPPAPNLNIGMAEQVNVGQRQLNVSGSAAQRNPQPTNSAEY